MKTKRVVIHVVMATMMIGSAAMADITQIYADADAYTYKPNPTSNYGSSGWLNGGQQFIGGESRSVINFNTSGILPNGATIQSVTLTFDQAYCYDYSGEDSVIGIFGVDGSWSESGVTWNTQPAMGSQIGSDTFTCAIAGYTDVAFDVTSAWSESANLDFYLAMLNPSTGLGILQPDSSEATDKPYLQVEYAIPEPATFGLLGLFGGGIFFIRRTFRI